MEPPLCSSGPGIETHRILLKLVPLLAAIGTQHFLSSLPNTLPVSRENTVAILDLSVVGAPI